MDIYTRVNELAADYSAKLTDKEFFLSSEYLRFIQKKAENIISGSFYTLRKEGFNVSEQEENALLQSLRITVDYDERDEAEQAYTTATVHGVTSIYLNAAGQLVREYSSRPDKHCAVLGMLYHEIGHQLFTDFPTCAAWGNQLQKNVWFPKTPEGLNTVNGANLANAMKDPSYCQLLAYCAHSIQNAIEDGFIERELREMYPVQGSECLCVARVVYADNAKTMEEETSEKEYSKFGVIFNQILYYATLGEIYIGNYNGELLDPMYECIELVDQHCYDRDPLKRVEAVNEILCILYPYLDDEIERQKKLQKDSSQNQDGFQQGNGASGSTQGNGSSQSQGSNGKDGNGTSSGSVPQNVADAIKNAVDKATASMNVADAAAHGANTSAVNNPTKVRNAANGTAPKQQNISGNTSGSANGNQSGLGSSDISTAMQRDADRLTASIANHKANGKAEAERTDEMNRNEGLVNGADYGCSNRKVCIARASDVPQSNIDAYDKAFEKLGPISKDLQRGIQRILKDRREGGKRRNLPFGRRLEVSSVVHNDGKYFSKNKLPTKHPKLGVALLIDQSGSTSGQLIDAAASTSIVVEDFCRELSIPHIISGYTTSYRSAPTKIISYVEPGTIDGNDKYRITGMRSGGGTPTLAATLYMLNHMKKLPVDIRLLIIITDGQSGDDRNNILRKVVGQAKKDDTIIVAAGIGNDRASVKNEFGDNNFLDITNLEDMPEQLIALIKRNLWV